MGKVVDLGIDDEANMGAAMAPAACDTIVTHFEETGRSPDYYDGILRGIWADTAKKCWNICSRKRELLCRNTIWIAAQATLRPNKRLFKAVRVQGA